MILITKPMRRCGRTTEDRLWLYVPKDYKPPHGGAQWASSTVMRETYLTFGMWTAGSPLRCGRSR